MDLLSRTTTQKSSSVANRTRTSGSVARNSDHWTTETVHLSYYNVKRISDLNLGCLHPVACVRSR
jgi:hypothetical protein